MVPRDNTWVRTKSITKKTVQILPRQAFCFLKLIFPHKKKTEVTVLF